jgi:integrase
MQFRLVKFRGKYAVAWTEDGSTVRRSLRTDDRRVAEKRFKTAVAELQKPDARTVSDVWALHEKDKEARGRASAKYHWKALEPVFGQMDCDRITVKDCRDYTRKRASEGKAPSTISTEMKHLRAALNWAQRHGIIDKAPFIEVPPESQPRDRYLTKDEMRRLVQAAVASHIRVAIELMLATAGRIGAVLELTWDRVDFDRGKIQLKKNNRGKGRAVVPITERMRLVLQEAHQSRLSNYVVEYGGGPVKSVRKGIANAAARAGIEDVTPHVMRHTAAVWMAEAGESMEEIAQFLGHTDVTVTRSVYARYSPEHLRKTAMALDF